MTRAFADFQGAIFKALAGDPGVVAIVGARIFDDVPHEGEAIASGFPRVSIGEQGGEMVGTDDSDIVSMEITVHAWSRAPGRRECLQLIGAIVEALHKRAHPVASGLLIFLNYATHETVKEPDGETYHGSVRFAGMLQIA